MTYPLVHELVADGIPVAVSCQVLKPARQPYYRWLENPITDAEVTEPYRANALFDAHRDDPEFGRRLAAEARAEPSEVTSDGTAWRITSANCCWSVFGKKRGKNGTKPGPRFTTISASLSTRTGVSHTSSWLTARTSSG